MTDIEQVDRNTALQLTERANYIIENYSWQSPGGCLCEHRLSHHTPAAFGRDCELCECALFVSSIGTVPWRRVSTVNYSDREPGTLREIIAHSLEWQQKKTHRLAQAAIERIYNER